VGQFLVGVRVITELEARNAIPPQGWIHDYCNFAEKQTTAPIGYHLACALAVLGATTPQEFGTTYGGSDIRGNLYALLVGRSGDEQKSSALGISKRVLNAVSEQLGKPLIGKHPGSTEGLVDMLVDNPRQILYYSEFGSFLAKSQKASYFEALKGYYTDLWDCQPQDRVKAGNNIISVKNPRLSIVAGCSLGYLEQHTDPHDWSGGFMGRWAVMYCRRERTVSYPKNDWSPIPGLAAPLLLRAQQTEAAPCLGLNHDSFLIWDQWFHNLEARPVPELITGAKTRVPTIALKTAMLYAWDFGDPLQGQPWYILPHHLYWGIYFAELHLKSVIGLASFLAEHNDARARRSILELIPPGGAKTLSQLLRSSKMKKRTLMEILDGLTTDGTLKVHIVTGGAGETLYERVT
jgi:hypothetical protein